MGYFENRDNVMNYISQAEGFDGKELIDILEKFLLKGSTVLELGMGPGKDMDIMEKQYNVTGSDISSVFLDLYREKAPEADLIQLDAENLDTQREFDCIYSNKVLPLLSPESLYLSFRKQKDILRPDGLVFHSFNYGEGKEEYKDLRFHYYQPEEIINMTARDYELILSLVYSELKEDDSFFIILQKKPQE